MSSIGTSPCGHQPSRISECSGDRSLLSDTEPQVTHALIWSEAARQRITHDWVMAAITRDTSIAPDIIQEIDAFIEVDSITSLRHLSTHADPTIRLAVAQRGKVGRAVLRRLYQDDDADVSRTAHRTLEN
jgi:hypothetical protein